MINSSRSITGVLSGNGTAMVHALVYHHPTPEQPPPALAEILDPVGGSNDQPADWQLSMRKLLAHRDDHVHDVWSSFSTWRRTFVADVVLGDVATVHAFLLWAQTVAEVGSLNPLNLSETHVSAKVAARIAWETHQVELATRGRSELGLGISVPQRAGLLRGFVLGSEPLVLLAEGEASVSAVPNGLQVLDPSASSGPKNLLVHGWVVDANGVTAISDEGPVPLNNTSGGRLLALVAPGVANASVGPAPLSAVFSGLMFALREASELAAADQIPLWICTGGVGHARSVVR